MDPRPGLRFAHGKLDFQFGGLWHLTRFGWLPDGLHLWWGNQGVHLYWRVKVGRRIEFERD